MIFSLFETRDGKNAAPCHSKEPIRTHVPLVKIHAGCEKTFPNSRNYLLHALKTGADIIEIDVQSAKDGTLLALHDDVLDGISVCQKNFDELSTQLPALLSLEQALEIVDGYSGAINLDLKHPMQLENLSELFKRKALKQQIILTGITAAEVEDCKRLFPKAQIWLSSPYYPNGIPLSERRDYEAECLQIAQSSGCSDLNLYIRNFWSELVQCLHTNGIRVHVWTVDAETDMQWVMELGADSIATNYPATLKALMQRIVDNSAKSTRIV